MAKQPPAPDTNETEAQKHVIEIMGPPQTPNGDIPVPAPMQQKEQPEAVEPVASAPEIKPEVAEVEVAVAVEPEAPAQVEDSAGAPETRPETETDLPGLEPEEEAATDAAVDDIIHDDADAALPQPGNEDAVVMKTSFAEKCKAGWRNWWSNPWKRYGTLVAVVVLLAAVFFVAPVRAFVLNAVGMRSSVTVDVLDGATNLPLENAVISVDGKSAKTNEEGKVTLKDLHLGSKEVQISKVAFATYKKQVNFGLRITDLGEITLKPAGAQLTYTFTDYLSGKPVAGVELTSGESTAKSDRNGKAIITVQPSDTNELKITAKKDGYRTDEMSAPADLTSVTKHKLVPANKAVFVSKVSGKYDVYKMYIDGKERKVLLEGTGLENQGIVALPNSAGDKVAVASTRDDKRNKDGYLLTALNIVDTETGEATNIEYAEQITLLGWKGETLVYTQTVAGASAANPARQKVIAYDFTSNKRYQLANANYFNGVQLVGSTVYYAVSSTDPAAKVSFAKVNLDGTGKKTLFTNTVWSLLRTDYGKMKFQAPDKWYEYTIGASAPVASTPVSDWTSRFYVDSPDGKTSVWVDVRDSKGVLTKYDVAAAKDSELTTQRNMQSPVYWLDENNIVYRVSGASEVADYVINVHGGDAHKISDVTLSGIR